MKKDPLDSFRKAEQDRRHYERMKRNPQLPEARLARLFVFIMTMLLFGTFFMGLFYLAYLVEGGWWSWIKYYCYGLGAVVAIKASLHRNVFP